MNQVLLLSLVLAAAICAAQAAPLAPGLYSFENVGYKFCDQETAYLGFNNKTCPIAPYARSASIGTNSVWKSWDVTITSYHSSGFPLALLSTGLPSGKTMRCPGNLTPLEPGTCGKSAVTIGSAQSEWRLVGPVSGYTQPTYKLVANMKRSGCARYLTTSSSCEDASLKLANSGDSTRALWELTPMKLGTKAPGPATIVTAVRGTGTGKTAAVVNFNAPTDAGCGPITEYTVTAKPLSGGSVVTKTVGGAATSAELIGLTANIRYNFTIDASNACGSGPTTWYAETLATSDAVAGAGYYGLCAVKSDSRLACFEYGDLEAFGELSPPSKWKQGNDIVLLASNERFTAALARNGTLGLWGENIETGCNEVSDDAFCLPPSYTQDIVYAHGWQGAMCFTRADGNVKCIGIDLSGDIGLDDLPGFQRDGSESDNGIEGYINGAKKAKVGQAIGCILYNDGNLRCWGNPSYWETGKADYPLTVSSFSDLKDMAVGGNGVCALKTNGDLKCSQYDSDSYDMLPIPETFDRDLESIDCSKYACCALKANGDFTCWGDVAATGECQNYDYCLGSIVNSIAGIGKYTWRTFSEYEISVGRKLLGSDGTSIRWPVLTEVVSYSLGKYSTCIIRKDGSLQCWGSYIPPAVVDWSNFQVQLTISGYDYLF